MEKINLRARKKARQLILQALYQWQIASYDLKVIEKESLAYFKGKESNRQQIDEVFFKEFLYQVPAHVTLLDEQLEQFCDRPVVEISPIEITILRIGLYEILYRLDVPYRVIINEAIELAKSYGANESHKFINGVLDKAIKQLRKDEFLSQS